MDPKVALRQMVYCMARAKYSEALEHARDYQSWTGVAGNVAPRMNKIERECYSALVALDEAQHTASAAYLEDKIT